MPRRAPSPAGLRVRARAALALCALVTSPACAIGIHGWDAATTDARDAPRDRGTRDAPPADEPLEDAPDPVDRADVPVTPPPDTTCTPNCAGRACGPDGCGGTCGMCAAGTACTPAGACACSPNCAGRRCGPDGCGGACGACGAGTVCNSAGACVCTPNCAGRRCGPDGCGGSCGSCPGGASCNSAGRCTSTCPCFAVYDGSHNNMCHNPPRTPGCAMTAPGGYCDPNGDGSYGDGNWVLGYEEYHAVCR